MKNIFRSITQENIIVGYLYFYVHFITEVLCFCALKELIGDSIFLWISPVLYDMFAFVPQGIIGYFNDRHPKMKCGIIGSVIMALGILQMVFNVIPFKYAAISLIGIGNAFNHIAGAEATLRVSNGKMSHSAIFVGGGAFGVVTGKIIGGYNFPLLILVPLILTCIPYVLLADSYKTKYSIKDCRNYNYANPKLNPWLIILLTTFVVMIRGYTGYGIPTSWDKTIFQTFILFVFMGIGKCLGGILVDSIGMRKTAIGSVLLAIPFLVVGDNHMIISLIGVLLFSMTMAVTLGLLVSVLKRNPGLAFGYTTIGLFLGSCPVFFVKITKFEINAIVITVLSLLCVFILNMVIRKDTK